MNTKDVWVYLLRWPEGAVSSMSHVDLAQLRRDRREAIDSGYPVSPIVKLTVPLPEAPRD